MSSYERISAYLEAHPTPWRLVARQRNWPSFQKEYILDARGNRVLLAERSDQYGDTWFVGDIRGLVDFVNLVGADYEPPCGWPGVDYGPIEPVDAGPYRRRLSDADMEQLKENMPESFAPEGVRGLLRRLGWRGLG